jgi:hypothetical protein
MKLRLFFFATVLLYRVSLSAFTYEDVNSSLLSRIFSGYLDQDLLLKKHV